MAGTSLTSVRSEIDYPTSDGTPMAETEWHLWNMIWLLQVLKRRYARDEAYVGGNMFVYYVEGNRNRHVAPDVFVAFGVPNRQRGNFKIWEEGRSPDVVFEFTSRSTQEEDEQDKFRIYRDEIRVREYFLFDPRGEYLDPPMKGYRLQGGEYVPIEPVEGRLPSEVLGLHLERSGWVLRLHDPQTGLWLPIPEEEIAQSKESVSRVEAERQEAEAARRQAEAEVERLRRELDELRGKSAES